MLSDDDVERLLIITPHPDDFDFGAAGSVATWTDRGIEVSHCVVTDGFDPAVPCAETPAIRRDEQAAAAKIVGVTGLHFPGHRDGRVVTSLELRRDNHAGDPHRPPATIALASELVSGWRVLRVAAVDNAPWRAGPSTIQDTSIS